MADNVEAKYQERIMGWSSSTTVYGNYYILTVQVTKVEESAGE